MHGKLASFLLLFLSPFCLLAQKDDPKLIEYKANKFIQEIGIFAGPSINFLRGNLEVDDGFQNERKLLVGRSVGVKIRSKTFLKKLTLSVAFMFDRKGGKSLSTGEYFDLADQVLKLGVIEFRYKYKYYTIPLRLEYAFGKKNKFKIEGGGYTSYLKKQVREREELFSSDPFSSFEETDFNYTMDYGVSMGVSYTLPIHQSFSISIELINNLGLRNIRPNLNPGQEMKTNSTALLIGIVF